MTFLQRRGIDTTKEEPMSGGEPAKKTKRTIGTCVAQVINDILAKGGVECVTAPIPKLVVEEHGEPASLFDVLQEVAKQGNYEIVPDEVDGQTFLVKSFKATRLATKKEDDAPLFGGQDGQQEEQGGEDGQ